MRILGSAQSRECNGSAAIPILYDRVAARSASNVEKYGTELDSNTAFCRIWPAVKRYWV